MILKRIIQGITDPKSVTPTYAKTPVTPVFSSQKLLMDYISIKGISERIGLAENDLVIFILKELLDNALDFVEVYGSDGSNRNQDGEVTEKVGNIDVKVNITNNKIAISYCNFGVESLSTSRLKSIFYFDRFYSSKKNIYRISRGSIGDALKEVICIPYALAADKGIENWNEPICINGNKMKHRVYLKVNRVEQTLGVDIEEQLPQSTGDYTTIEVSLPPEAIPNEFGLYRFLKHYSMLNPHITFQLEFNTETIHKKFFLSSNAKAQF